MSEAAERVRGPSQYRMFFEAVPCPGWILKAATRRILDVNPAAIQSYGYSRAEFLAMSLDDLSPESERGRQRGIWRRSRRGTVSALGQHLTKTGRVLDVHVQAARLRRRGTGRGSELVCLAWIDLGVSQADETLHTFVDGAPVGLLTVDRAGRIVAANRCAAALLQTSEAALRGVRLDDIACADTRAVARAAVTAVRNRRTWTGTLRVRGHGSESFEAELRVGGGGRSDHRVIAFYDVSDRQAADRALRLSGERYRRLSDHDRTVREEERARIARELHDQLGQSLSAFKMDLAWLSALADRQEPKTARAAVAGMMDRVDTAINIVRRIAGDLRPGVLDRLGLVAAIEWQAAEFERRTGVRCKVTCHGECPPFDRLQSTEIFRIVQETLSNVSRHAAAASVKVTMTSLADRVVLRVSDNGRGIPQDAIDSEQSLGLIGMRERATILGGTLTLSRGPRRGTDALLVIPHRPTLVGHEAGPRTES